MDTEVGRIAPEFGRYLLVSAGLVLGWNFLVRKRLLFPTRPRWPG